MRFWESPKPFWDNLFETAAFSPLRCCPSPRLFSIASANSPARAPRYAPKKRFVLHVLRLSKTLLLLIRMLGRLYSATSWDCARFGGFHVISTAGFASTGNSALQAKRAIRISLGSACSRKASSRSPQFG
jgi:hypothetical protein